MFRVNNKCRQHHHLWLCRILTCIIWSVSRRKYEASWTSILSSSHDTSVPSTGLLLACEVHFWNLWSRDGNCESVLDNFSPVPSVVILGSVIAIFSILFMFISRSAPISGSIVRVFTRTKKRCDSPPITDKIGTIIIQPNPFYDGDSPYLRPTTPLHTTCWSQNIYVVFLTDFLRRSCSCPSWEQERDQCRLRDDVWEQSAGWCW